MIYEKFSPEKFSSNLRIWMAYRSLNAIELSLKTKVNDNPGVNRNLITALMKNKEEVEKVSNQTLKKLADALGTTVEILCYKDVFK